MLSILWRIFFFIFIMHPISLHLACRAHAFVLNYYISFVDICAVRCIWIGINVRFRPLNNIFSIRLNNRKYKWNYYPRNLNHTTNNNKYHWHHNERFKRTITMELFHGQEIIISEILDRVRRHLVYEIKKKIVFCTNKIWRRSVQKKTFQGWESLPLFPLTISSIIISRSFI